MEVKKKVWSKFFEAILSGKKKFELHLADFEVKEGDVLVLEEWDPETNNYTGRKISKKVGYVVKTKGQKFWKEEDVENYGYQIIGFV
ncbi:hypothetical protein AUJ84_02350 [Candidatus Pacearchaeota archaeon CG1_02_32_132]|nr:MAG: hypothetical protein AUJ84_02350 [Candidatus Pacearchaeota archaeon CG1_02_32_132]